MQPVRFTRRRNGAKKTDITRQFWKSALNAGRMPALPTSSLRHLCDLGVSAVNIREGLHRWDAENAEITAEVRQWVNAPLGCSGKTEFR